jgi:hypothetical protein
MRLAEELKRVFSKYLCTECKELLYFDINSKEEVCVNSKCVLHPPFLKFRDVSRATTLKKELKHREASLKRRIMQMNRSSFIRFLYQQRSEVIKNMITKGGAKFEKLLVIDELLILVNSINFVDSERDQSSFRKILKEYTQFFNQLNFIEDMENLRVLFSVENKVYMLKYWRAILELYKSYGIIAGRTTDLMNIFKYDEINLQAKEKLQFRYGMDMAKFFEQQFDFITALKYILERYYRTSRQHNYDPSVLDITVLLALFFSTRRDLEFWARQSLRRQYDIICMRAKIEGDFEGFVNKYITSRKNAPIIVFDGTSYIFDKETLLFYIYYLTGRNRRKLKSQKGTGEERIMKKKQQSAGIFEEHIRKHLREYGFKGPDKPLLISEQNEKYEYDVIGVKENSKELVLVEAKYRDFSPSSLTGKTLIDQELFDEDNGLLVEAIKHQARLEFFYKYFDRFKRELSLKSPLEQYLVSACLVTKHPPLISKYRQVLVVVYDDFCERFKLKARSDKNG